MKKCCGIRVLALKCGLFCLLFGFFCSAVNAKLVLSAPPRETLQDGEKYYAPIAKYLSKVLREEVVYEHPVNWTNYTRDMRAGKYDIVFDGPHFVAWRMKHVKHIPIARLAGTLDFMVLAKKTDKKVNSMRDLIGKSICGLASPNLGTVSAFAMYNNPVIQPDIKIISGGMKTVMKKFLQGECQYAVVRDKLYKKLPTDTKKLLKIVAKSQPVPNQTISVSTKITQLKRDKIAATLTSEQGAAVADLLLTRFSKKKKYFIPAKVHEFNGLEDLLEGVVWGW